MIEHNLGIPTVERVKKVKPELFTLLQVPTKLGANMAI